MFALPFAVETMYSIFVLKAARRREFRVSPVATPDSSQLVSRNDDRLTFDFAIVGHPAAKRVQKAYGPPRRQL
jgi:hypothetical protein